MKSKQSSKLIYKYKVLPYALFASKSGESFKPYQVAAHSFDNLIFLLDIKNSFTHKELTGNGYVYHSSFLHRDNRNHLIELCIHYIKNSTEDMYFTWDIYPEKFNQDYSYEIR
jgi:hypothetical protein